MSAKNRAFDANCAGFSALFLALFFTRVARAHAGLASNHSTPAACRPPNSADGGSLALVFLPTPAIHKNPHLGVTRAACICPPGAELARMIVLSATAPVHGSIKHGKNTQARKNTWAGSSEPAAARHHQRPGISWPRAGTTIGNCSPFPFPVPFPCVLLHEG